MTITLAFVLELLGGTLLTITDEFPTGWVRIVVIFIGWGFLRWGFHREYRK
jgi:hypothetical protein